MVKVNERIKQITEGVTFRIPSTIVNKLRDEAETKRISGGNGGGEEPSPIEPVLEPEPVVCDPVTQTLENGECVDVPVPVIECEPGFVLNEAGDACEPVAQTQANTTTPTSTPLTPFQGVIAIPDPDCIAGRSVDNIPACEDPSIAQFAKTCESVPREVGGGGFEDHCIVDRNACANADFQLISGVCQAPPPAGQTPANTTTPTQANTTTPTPANTTTPTPTTSQPIVITGSCNNFNFQNQINSGNNALGQQGSGNEGNQDISQQQSSIQNVCTTIQQIENRIIKNYLSSPTGQQQISQVSNNGLVRLDTIQICSQLGDQACIASNSDFKILFSQVTQDSLGNWVLNGEVQNVGNQPHNMVTTIFYLYDAQGNIIGLNQGNTMPENLNSMQTGLFNSSIANSNLISPPQFYRVSYAFGT